MTFVELINSHPWITLLIVIVIADAISNINITINKK